MEKITSVNNQQVKKWKKLHTSKERNKTQSYLIEGFHLVEEALNFKNERIHHIIIDENYLDSEDFIRLFQSFNPSKIILITPEIAERISFTQANQGVFAEMAIEQLPFPEKIERPFLLLDAVQDPGNVGTLIRTADAAGFQGVLLGKGTVDLYNDKTLRSAQGSHFHIEVYKDDLEGFIAKMKQIGIPIIGTALDSNAMSYKDMQVESPFSLVVGNEGAGVSAEILNLVDETVYIPMKGRAESLNVAIAASIIMFQLNE